MLYLRYYLWIAPYLLLCALLIVGFRRKLHKQAPVFFYFGVAEIVLFAALLAVSLLFSLSTYQWCLVFGESITYSLELCVVYELARQLLFSRSFLARRLDGVLRWSAASHLLMAGILSALLSQPGTARVWSAFQILEVSANLLKIGFLFTLLLLTSTLGISWKTLLSGIALGFGVSAGVQMATAALLSSTGRGHHVALDMINMAAFHLCVLIWLVYVLRTEEPHGLGGRLPQSDLELWNQELQRMAHL